MAFTKTLWFRTDNLGHQGLLIYTFDDSKIADHTMYEDYFPVVWKVVELQAKGKHEYHVDYYQQFALATSQVDKDNVVTTASIVDIDFQQVSTVTGNDHSGYDWSTPAAQSGLKNNQFAGTNGAAKLLHLAVCTDPPSNSFVEPLLYADTPASGTVTVEFTGRLRIYAVVGLQEGQVIREEIKTEKLWDQLLSDPALPEKWVVTYNKTTGNFEINPEADT